MPTLRLLAVAALLGALGTAPPATAAEDRVTGMVADYSGGNTVGAELREPKPRADGYHHIDVDATIAKLKQLNVNSYLFLVWRSPADWDDLAEFLPRARQAGIGVWVYLVPPSECDVPPNPDRCSYPYKTDYVAWAKAIAERSREHDNLRGWMIDDFGHNLEGSGRKPSFTPAYLARMRATTKAINEDLAFLPLLYTYQVTDAFLDEYAGLIDGVTLAYKDDPARNTVMTHTLRPQLDAVLATAARYRKPVVLMLYAGRYTASPLMPSTTYVRTVVDQGLAYLSGKRIAGVVAYGAQLDGGLALREELRARTGRGRLALGIASHVATPRQSYVEAAQYVRVTCQANVKVTFAHRDHRRTNVTLGTHQKQLLVDGKVVWRQNTSPTATAWQAATVDLTAAVRGRQNVRLAFRLTGATDIVNSDIDVAIDNVTGTNLTVTNAGFEDPTGWQLLRSGARHVVAIDRYDPDRPRHTFEVLRQRFAAAR